MGGRGYRSAPDPKSYLNFTSKLQIGKALCPVLSKSTTARSNRAKLIPTLPLVTSHQSLLIQRLYLRIHQKRVVELRHFPPAFTKNRQQPRGERFVPLERQAGHVSDDEREFFRTYVAGQGNSVEARAAHRRITEQRINRNMPFAPALRQPRILQDRQHQTRVACLFYFDVLNCRGNRRCRRQRSTHADRLRGQIFDRGSDGSILSRRRRGR